ncbi:MAG: hypothetical protein QOE41_870 [Mycobacterium sp.]|nr:hypothetical protein [Mycobacterium sp.]
MSGDLLRHVSTADSARDLDRLRQAVGDRELTYYGESYGTFLGQTYANLFPTRVRAMALDSVIDPVSYTAGAEERVAATMTDTGRVVAEFDRLCEAAGTRRCALAGAGGATGRITELIDRLEQGPMPAPTATSRARSRTATRWSRCTPTSAVPPDGRRWRRTSRRRWAATARPC